MPYYILKSYKLDIEPFEIFQALSKEKNCFFLESSLAVNSLGRFSFLGIEPFFILKTKEENPFGILRRELAKYAISIPGCDIPLLGAAVGYLSYDLGFILEKKVKKKYKPDLDIPACYFGFYNTVVIVDHYRRLFFILSLGYPEKKYYLARKLAEENFAKIHKLLSKPLNAGQLHKNHKSHRHPRQLSSNFSKAEYIRAIKKAKAYIQDGDIYQVNLSQQFTCRTDLSAVQIYRRLRHISPSCFSAYFDAGDSRIISSSPERFLKLRGNIVTTRPMKGTRPRSENKITDGYFKKDLLKSTKDKAELTMITDLERNDLGRVCDYNSIKVLALRELEEYNTVFQTTADIEGRLNKHNDRIDVLRACFPGGSITGCPKIRAMQIIEELEPSRRNVYTGCLGYLSFSGDMDFNILIRSILKKESALYFAAGGGIVADSNPEKEYEETLIKARGIFKAINADKME